MNIVVNYSVNFKRLLKPSEEKEYKKTLENGLKASCGADNHRTILVLPVSSLPQKITENTGVGNLCEDEAHKFIDFAKLYWGINEIQLLPVGQYHLYQKECPIYSGTTMNLGNHMINIKDFISEQEFKKIVSSNSNIDTVNFSNVVEPNSEFEHRLLNLYKNMPKSLSNDFEKFKNNLPQIIERKSLYRALREINNSHDYKTWNNIDSNLFNDNVVDKNTREKRIEEVKKIKSECIDYYKFKNFLAELSFKKAKEEINKKGIKLIGDMPIGFSFDEVWSYPDAFLKDYIIKEWELPVLDVNSRYSENILREKTAFYANHFDGIRIDASWSYITPNIVNINSHKELKLNNEDKFLNIIDDEVKKCKGTNYDMNNIIHEFAANPDDQFNIYNSNSLKPFVKDRVKIYTSDYLSENWGSADNFKKRGWADDKFIIGAVNHDSQRITPKPEQIIALSKIFNIPEKKLQNAKEFLKTKFAEPLSAKNNLLFFASALGLDGQYNNNKDKKDNFIIKIPENYREKYSAALKSSIAYNPMDALEKQFKAQGLDKKEPALYKKIVKYKRVLEDNHSKYSVLKILVPIAVILTVALCVYGYYKAHSPSSSK